MPSSQWKPKHLKHGKKRLLDDFHFIAQHHLFRSFFFNGLVDGIYEAGERRKKKGD